MAVILHIIYCIFTEPLVDGGPCVVSDQSTFPVSTRVVEPETVGSGLHWVEPDPKFDCGSGSGSCSGSIPKMYKQILKYLNLFFSFQYFTCLVWTKLPFLRTCFEAITIFRTTSIWHSHQAPEPNWKRTGSATLVSTELDFLTLRQATTRQSIKTSVTAKIRKKFASQS